jgi:hypothetical protein
MQLLPDGFDKAVPALIIIIIHAGQLVPREDDDRVEALLLKENGLE